MQLTCTSGTIDANVGDQFSEPGTIWEIIGFKKIINLDDPKHPTTITVSVTGNPLPSWFVPYKNADGSVDFRSDSVAAALLTKQDGKVRTPRGDIVKDLRLA